MAATTRRSFLGELLKSTLAIGLLGSLGAALAYVYSPAKRSSFGGVIQVGKASEIPIGGGKFVWFKGQPLWVLRMEKGFAALAARCPRGCLLKWDDKRKVLVDPCHGGTFDTNGNPLTGLHSSPLTRFEAKVNRDEVYLREPRWT